MLHGQMLPGQMSFWHFESIQDDPRNLRLKFCQNRFGNSWDITDIEFTGWVVGGGWCAKSFLRLTQLKVMLGWIEVELGFWQQAVIDGEGQK